MLSGEGTATFAARWCGSVQRVARSTLRPGHQRKNWFVGITLLPEVPASAVLDPGDVKTEAFRAGGPGGQHQNVTDSAVRATHGPTVLAVVVRGDRSQHRNKAEALRRLGLLVAQSGEADRLAADRVGQAAHDRLVRGAPVRVLR